LQLGLEPHRRRGASGVGAQTQKTALKQGAVVVSRGCGSPNLLREIIDVHASKLTHAHWWAIAHQQVTALYELERDQQLAG
jgi:hypothetical protein